MLFPLKMESFHQLGGIYMKINMAEATAWARITAYMAENKLNTAFEAESQQNMAVEARIEDWIVFMMMSRWVLRKIP